MGLGAPQTPFLSYIPGSAVVQLYIGGSQEFGYTPVALLTAALPDPTVAGLGARAWVSDATSRTFGAAPTGSGSDTVPVWTDGVTWYIG